jgi:hypothetical protein
MSLATLSQALRDHGGTVAQLAIEPQDAAEEAGGGAAHVAARGPRAAAAPDEYELLLEMIREGSLLHYGVPRVLRVEDPDLALLLGDELYALGLARLAELGDLQAVAELADLISLEAQARAGDDAELAEAVWRAGAAAIGWGSTAAHREAKGLARAGDPGAVRALLAGAQRGSSGDPH